MVVLVIANVSSVTTNTGLSRRLEAQHIEITKNNSSINRLTERKEELKAELKSERTKLAELEKENASLKVELQAKIERESRRTPNTYALGNCTWYVKDKVPYVGKWGNANTWLAGAQNDGFDTGEIPKPGAVGVSFEGYYGHVVYVETINEDGSVTISEMNNSALGGFNIVNKRTVSSQSFVYIYT